MLLSYSTVTQKPDPFGQDFSSKYLSFSKAWTSNLLYSTVTSGVEMQQKQRMVQVSLYFQLILKNILNLLNHYLTMLNVVYIGEI